MPAARTIWLPEKLKALIDQGPWVVLLLALGVAVGASALLDKIEKLRKWMSGFVLAGVDPRATSPAELSFWPFAIIFGFVLATLFFGLLYLLAEYKRKTASENLDERKSKSYLTLQGMMKAATRVRTQAYPTADLDRSLDRLYACYEIEKDLTTRVTREYVMRAGKTPLHFWEFSFSASGNLAEPMEYLTDIDFQVRDTSGRGDIVYLPTINERFKKSVSIYFLPRIEPQGGSRVVEISYRWPGLCKSLVRDGEDSFGSMHSSADPIKEVMIEVFLEDGTGGRMTGEIGGPRYPGATVTAVSHPKTKWPGFRYVVPDAPPGKSVEHMVVAKWVATT